MNVLHPMVFEIQPGQFFCNYLPADCLTSYSPIQMSLVKTIPAEPLKAVEKNKILKYNIKAFLVLSRLKENRVVRPNVSHYIFHLLWYTQLLIVQRVTTENL